MLIVASLPTSENIGHLLVYSALWLKMAYPHKPFPGNISTLMWVLSNG